MVERIPNRDDEPATRGDLKELRAELREENKEFRTELRGEMARADVMDERFKTVDAQFSAMRFEMRAWVLGAFLVWSGGAEAGVNWVKSLFS